MSKTKKLPISCKFWCNWCEKYVPLEEVTMNQNFDGDAVFVHRDNHLLEIDTRKKNHDKNS